MKPLISLTIAATKRYVRNVSTLVFSLFIPIALIFVFGAFTNQAPSKYSVGLVDNANSEISKQFVETLKKVPVFEINTGNENDEHTKIDKGDRDLVIVIPANFGLVNTYIAAPALNTSDSYVQLLYNAGKQQQGQTSKQVVLQILDTQFNFAGQRRRIGISEETINSKNLTIIDFLVPGLIAQSIMQLGIFGVAFAFVSQKVTGVLKRILATPVKAWQIIVAEGFARVIVSFLQIVILIGVSVAVYQLKVVGNLFLVGALALMGIIIFQSIGFAIAGYAKDENQVAPLAQIITLPMLLLSGVFFSRDVFPAWLKTVTDFFPLTYLADGMRAVMNTGAGLDVIAGDFLGLFVWMIIAFFLAYRLFKWE